MANIKYSRSTPFVLCILVTQLVCPMAGYSQGDTIKQLCKWDELRAPLSAALEKAGDNRLELEKAIREAPDDEHRKCAIFLISYMPQRDLAQMKATFILDNTAIALRARHANGWASAVDEQLFLNDVLPYAILNENRDKWRGEFYKLFSPVVKDCKTLVEAIYAVSGKARELLKVEYSTKRKKPDQSPRESMDSGIASCTGLSILLADAMRSVGIPARIVGVPRWTTKPGNHNWVEVWTGKTWSFTEYHPDKKGLDHGWLLADAGRADPDKWQYRIYASSFSPDKYHFPLVWNRSIKYVHAVDVTQKYLDLWKTRQKEKEETHGRIGLVLLQRASGKRVSGEVIIKLEGKEVAKGTTKGPQSDMNDMLEFQLLRGKTFTVEYRKEDGSTGTREFTVGKGKAVQRLELYAD